MIRVISLRRAVKPRNGVLIYGTVQSISRPQKLNHTVTFRREGWLCTCEGGTFGNLCEHVKRANALAIRRGYLTKTGKFRRA